MQYDWNQSISLNQQMNVYIVLAIVKKQASRDVNKQSRYLIWIWWYMSRAFLSSGTDQQSLTSEDGFCYINLFYDNFILTSLNAFSSSDLLIVWSLSKLCFLKTWKIHNYDNSSLHYINGE